MVCNSVIGTLLERPDHMLVRNVLNILAISFVSVMELPFSSLKYSRYYVSLTLFNIDLVVRYVIFVGIKECMVDNKLL